MVLFCKLWSHLRPNLIVSMNTSQKMTRFALIHSSIICHKKVREDRRTMIDSMPKKDEGISGESAIDIDASGFSAICEFPDINTPNRIFDDLRFADTPIVYIKVTKNNTIMSFGDAKGKILERNSCRTEGFKNCRKGTNVAAQATGISMSRKVLNNGIKTVRIMIKGLGPGRMSSVKGLQMGGLNIISITDATPICEAPDARPPAAKSL